MHVSHVSTAANTVNVPHNKIKTEFVHQRVINHVGLTNQRVLKSLITNYDINWTHLNRLSYLVMGICSLFLRIRTSSAIPDSSCALMDPRVQIRKNKQAKKPTTTGWKKEKLRLRHSKPKSSPNFVCPETDFCFNSSPTHFWGTYSTSLWLVRQMQSVSVCACVCVS